MSEFWNKMYDEEEFTYGEEPNRYFSENIVKYKPGKILLPADGEGRNGVFAAKLGWDVFCFDVSVVGKEKALKLSEKNNVSINYKISSLDNCDYEENSFDCIVLTYVHFINHSEKEYKKILDKYLKKGGVVILEGFSKKHLGRQGGPGDINMLFNLEGIKDDFYNYEIINLEEKEVLLEEGKGHNGNSILIRFMGRKK